MQTVAAKKCPVCGIIQDVHAQTCACGHVFRTQFNSTPPIVAALDHKPKMWVLAPIIGVFCITFLAIGYASTQTNEPQPQPHPTQNITGKIPMPRSETYRFELTRKLYEAMPEEDVVAEIGSPDDQIRVGEGITRATYYARDGKLYLFYKNRLLMRR